MGRANLCRAEQARLDVVAHALKASDDLGKSQIEVSFDVFGEYPFGSDLADDAGDFRPEVPGIGGAEPSTGGREGLAGIAGSDKMNAATPRAAVEGSDIVPDRCLIQGLVCHPGHEHGRRECFPLDETDSAISGFSDVEAKLQSANTGTEGEPEKGLGRNRGGM